MYTNYITNIGKYIKIQGCFCSSILFIHLHFVISATFYQSINLQNNIFSFLSAFDLRPFGCPLAKTFKNNESSINKNENGY